MAAVRPHLELGGWQKNGLQSGLSMAGRAVRLGEALVTLTCPPGTTGTDGVARFRELARRFQAELAEMNQDFDLGFDARDVRPIIQGQILHALHALEASRDELQREAFGVVDPEMKEYLRPRMASLILLAKELHKALGAIPPAEV
ncbi:MAG TPA: hypothetical protein VG370_09405 [Chloroflexota bacterium]|nr:hypothetical protein [Chloroflexota bacterium]